MKPRIALAALIASLCMLAGCANPQSRQVSMEAAQQAAQAKDDAVCREKGLTPGTKDFDACLQRLAEARADEAAAAERRRIEFQRTLGAGTSDYSGH
jgi:uncharacterized lipoprotein YajG